MRFMTCRIRSLAAALGMSCAATAAYGGDVGTAFTYQGRLTDNGAAANGLYDFQFRLFTGEFPFGFAVGSPVTLDNVSVTNGLFTAALDFGNLFPGEERWLDISVRPGASAGAYTTLAPRQELTPAPYAIGLALPYTAAHASTAPLVNLDQTGAGPALTLSADAGHALSAQTSAGGEAVYAQTTGGGIPVYGYNLGASGEAGYFRSESVLNGSPTLNVQNNGTGAGVQATARLGPAGLFQITNASSNARAVDATTVGAGDAVRATIGNELNSGIALWARTFGLGRAALVEISNINSTAPALEVKTNGTGPAGKFVGDVDVLGDVAVDGALYANFGPDLHRASPIAYGRLGHSMSFSGSGNVDVQVLASENSFTTYEVTVLGETAPTTWMVLANVTYTNPQNPTRQYVVRTSPPDAFGKFKIHLQCTSNCDVFSTQTYGVSFVVYRP